MRVCMCELFNLYVESRLVIAFEEKKLDTVLKSRDYFADKVLYSQSYGFSSSHVWM